jgi:hypothetical protein
MRDPRRTAAALIAVYPAAILLDTAIDLASRAWDPLLVEGLPMAAVSAVAAAGLWRGRPWAFALSLVLSAAAGTLLLLAGLIALLIAGPAYFTTWPVAEWVAVGHFPLASGACLLAAWRLLHRHARRDAAAGEARLRVRRALWPAFMGEAALLVLIAIVGLGGHRELLWHQQALLDTQMPSALPLQLMALCCGHGGGCTWTSTTFRVGDGGTSGPSRPRGSSAWGSRTRSASRRSCSRRVRCGARSGAPARRAKRLAPPRRERAASP